MLNRADQGEVLGPEPVDRLEGYVAAALRRKPVHEDKLAGALRALTPYSSRVRALTAQAVDVLVKRASYGRPLYAAAIRALAEADGRQATAHLKKVLMAEDAGGLCSLSAACFVKDENLSSAVARVAASRHPHLAFAAEVARIARGESGGQHIAALAPKIKESHRITLCAEIFVPLLRHPGLPLAIAPALSVLRGAERHLGRWLVFAEIATRAGDAGPAAEARERAATGPSSARAAWSFVAWALERGRVGPPEVRPTVELIARLSDRPSADRDPTFLYRLAEAGIVSARPMLENLAKGSALRSPAAVRAAFYLARDHDREDHHKALAEVAGSARQEGLRGLAAAALHDVIAAGRVGAGEATGEQAAGGGPGAERARLERLSGELVKSRQLPTMTWAALIRAAFAGKVDRLVMEPRFRQVQLGWVE